MSEEPYMAFRLPSTMKSWQGARPNPGLEPLEPPEAFSRKKGGPIANTASGDGVASLMLCFTTRFQSKPGAKAIQRSPTCRKSALVAQAHLKVRVPFFLRVWLWSSGPLVSGALVSSPSDAGSSDISRTPTVTGVVLEVAIRATFAASGWGTQMPTVTRSRNSGSRFRNVHHFWTLHI